MMFSRGLKFSEEDIPQMSALQYKLMAKTGGCFFLLLWVVMEVGYGISHTLVDYIGTAHVNPPFAVFYIKMFGKGYFDLRGCTRDDRAFNRLFAKGVDARHKDLCAISVGWEHEDEKIGNVIQTYSNLCSGRAKPGPSRKEATGRPN